MNINEYKDRFNELTNYFLSQMENDCKDENIVYSPLSIFYLLGIACISTDTNTRKEILKTIAPNISYDDFVELLNDFKDKFSNSNELNIANAVITKHKTLEAIKDGFKDKLKELLDGEVISSTNLIKDTNKWVNNKTHGMIDKVLDDSMDDILMVLINALSFEATWENEVDDYEVKEETFNNVDRTKSTVNMMETYANDYVEDDNFTGFVKYYTGRKYSFMALLPKDTSCRTPMAKLLDSTNITKLYKSKDNDPIVEVWIPEFEADTFVSLNNYFNDLGINSIFTESADFSPLSSEWLKCDNVIHKAHIDVDRNGTKAAAITAAELLAGSVPNFDNIKNIKLNRPFIYAIMHNETGLPVFVGEVNKL